MKILLNNFLIFNQMLTYSQNTHSMNEVALFLQIFKNKEAPIPVHLCIKSLI